MALQTYAITRLSGLQFTVVSDLTGYFEEYRPILLVGDTQTRLYVNSSSYDLVLTTVTVSGGTIPASASGVAIGDLSITNSAIPYEYLDTLYTTTAEMTTISGDLVSYIDTISGGLQTQIDAIDTSNYYTKSETDTISGSLHAEIENIDLTTLSGDLVIGYTNADTTLSGLLHAEILAASGTTNHSLLTSLDYASAGHTGFQPAGDYVTTATLTTTSGDIIDYVDQEIVALSGSIVLDHAGLLNLDYTSSLHTGFQPAGDYATNSGVNVISGAIVSQIPSLSGYATEIYVDTASGVIVNDYQVADNNIYNAGTLYTDIVVSGVESSLTSHTTNANIHFTEAAIRHSVIDGLEGDDHTQYLTEARGDARYYTEGEVDSISGSIVGQIITSHGALSNKNVDDHTQYILVNGGRAFTSTVAGITPSANEDLATKGYVDAVWGVGISVSAGLKSITSGTVSTVVDFGLEFPNNAYGLSIELENLVDPNPSIYDLTVTEVTTSGFSIEYTGVIDSDNYSIRYLAVTSGTISATDHGSLSGLADDDHAQYLTTGRGDGRYYLKSEVDSISGTLESTKANVVHGHVKADISDLGTPMNNVVEDTTPQLGGNLDLNGKCLNYGTILTSSGTYTGDLLTVVVDDASSVFGSVLCQGADFHYDRADADASSTAPVYFMALEAGAGTKTILIRGQVCDTAWNWAAGKLYLSTDIGTMTQTKPSGSADQIQVLGVALSADTIWFDPVTMVAEVA